MGLAVVGGGVVGSIDLADRMASRQWVLVLKKGCMIWQLWHLRLLVSVPNCEMIFIECFPKQMMPLRIVLLQTEQTTPRIRIT